ncbi:hypothetical protein FHU38_003114 [Saccharomonospora amisosensis]|uniref:Uncharacterized protein n=1 Tax=Saccharomonospora amisosensis TaxID=1128677 RepID=A0A7X5URC7_9PSEU|nr:hypothetical protein [Saccharomonospora amisosensis]NIJ12770.1 hypothetical protein [Saccharomonospora amisosensis]
MAGRDPIVTPLQASVHRKLDELALEGNDASSEMRPEPGAASTALLAGALRSVLADHRLDPSGHCAFCHGRRRPFSRRRSRLPCRAYLAAQISLGTGDDTAEELSADSNGHHRRRKPSLHYAG